MECELRGIALLRRHGDEIEHHIGPPFECAADGGVERLFIAHFRAVEADDHERPTINYFGERGCAWRPARRARRCGDGVGGQTLAIELAVPDREREGDEVP